MKKFIVLVFLLSFVLIGGSQDEPKKSKKVKKPEVTHIDTSRYNIVQYQMDKNIQKVIAQNKIIDSLIVKTNRNHR